MSVQYKGRSSSSLLPEYDFAPNLPGVKTHREIGPPEYILSRAIALRNAGYTTATKQEGDTPLWSLSARIEGDPANAETLENTHELRANLLNPDIKTNAVLQRRLAAVYNVLPGEDFTISILAAVESMATQIRNSDTAAEDYDASILELTETYPTSRDGGALAIELLELLLTGVSTYLEFQYVYVHTFNLGVGQAAEIDYSNVGKIFTASPIDAEGIPTSLNLPDGMEWIKIAPEKVVNLGQGESLKYEYWSANEWSRLIFEVAT